MGKGREESLQPSVEVYKRIIRRSRGTVKTTKNTYTSSLGVHIDVFKVFTVAELGVVRLSHGREGLHV